MAPGQEQGPPLLEDVEIHPDASTLIVHQCPLRSKFGSFRRLEGESFQKDAMAFSPAESSSESLGKLKGVRSCHPAKPQITLGL